MPSPLIIMGVVLLLVGALGYWQYDRANSLQEDLATSKANTQRLVDTVEQQNQNILLMEELQARDQARLTELGGNLNDVREQRDEAAAKLDSYRSRLLGVALKRPGLLGRLSSRATSKLMSDVYKASGGRTKNTDNKKAAPAPAPASGASENKDSSPDTPSDSGTK